MKKIILLFLTVYLFSLTGCNKHIKIQNELTQTKAELIEVRKERDFLRNEVKQQQDAYDEYIENYLEDKYELQQEVLRLEQRVRSLRRADCEITKDENARLKKWTRALAKGYGPGIWRWSVEYDYPLYERKPRTPSTEGIINELNESFSKQQSPLLVLKKVEDNIVYVGTTDDRKLTTRMGSYGANSYVQTALFSLVSLEGVNCIYLDIEEGDHMAPGRICL